MDTLTIYILVGFFIGVIVGAVIVQIHTAWKIANMYKTLDSVAAITKRNGGIAEKIVNHLRESDPEALNSQMLDSKLADTVATALDTSAQRKL